MTAANALRFLARQAERCREHDEHEALCLLLPALMRVLDLSAMASGEAVEFRVQFKNALAGLGQTNQNGHSTKNPGPADPSTGDFRHDPRPSTVGCGGAT